MFRVFDNSVSVDELEKVGYSPHQRFAFMANLPQGTLPSIYSVCRYVVLLYSNAFYSYCVLWFVVDIYMNNREGYLL